MHEGMPTVTEHHKKLAALAGKWAGEEKLHPSPWDDKGGSAMGRVDARIDVDGFYLISDYVQERGGQVCYRGHGVFGYDPQSNKYLLHWFDSMGMPCTEPCPGTWQGNVLSFQMASPMGHHRYVYTFEGEGRYRFNIDHSQDAKTWAPFMEGRYTRK